MERSCQNLKKKSGIYIIVINMYGMEWDCPGIDPVVAGQLFIAL